MAQRDLVLLHPAARRLVGAWLSDWEERHPGTILLVTCTLREATEQAILYRQNRTRRQIEWMARRLEARGLPKYAEILRLAPPQPGPPPRTKITKAGPGTSYHQSFLLDGERGALATDFVPLVHGKAGWNERELIREAGELAEARGLTWSGRWGWESVHVQYDDGGRLDPWGLARGDFA